MTTTPASTNNKTTKVKRLKEDMFCVFLVFFCDGSFFYAFIKLFFFFITKNLIIIFKLSTIESLYYIKKYFTTILVFLGFCHNLKEIAKEEENI
jgi:hypothetical protein